MRILVACERSGIVRDALIARGHDAWSCDTEDTDGGGRHIKGDVLGVLGWSWDMLIGFPPCTHLAASGARWFSEKRRNGKQQQGLEFFQRLYQAPIPLVALENPVGVVSTLFRPPDQIIQPWQFGHGEVKTTCLWLKGLPLLTPTTVVEGREQKAWRMSPCPNRAYLRAKTYPGIAKAMAEQWT